MALLITHHAPCTTENLATKRTGRSLARPMHWHANRTVEDNCQLPPPLAINRIRPEMTPKNDPVALVRNLARALVEVRQGCRPLGGLRRWVHYSLCQTLQEQMDSPPPPRKGFPSRVLSCRIHWVNSMTAEASVIVECLSRVHAVALRVELTRGRWIITALEIG